MDISHFPPPPSPWPARVARDLEVLLLSIFVGFCIWFVGGWMLAGQVSPPPTAPIYSEDEGTPEGAGSSSAVVAEHRADAFAHAVAESAAVTAAGPLWARFGPDATSGIE